MFGNTKEEILRLALNTEFRYWAVRNLPTKMHIGIDVQNEMFLILSLSVRNNNCFLPDSLR